MRRSLRMLRLAGINYASCREHLLSKHPNFPLLSYAEQQKYLFGQFYNYSDSFSWAMKSLGHEAYEVVYDFEIMQKTWARENECPQQEHWRTQILLSQIAYYKPDVLYLQDIHCLPDSIRNRLKEIFPFIKLLIIYRGFPGWDSALAGHLGKADLLLVGSPVLMRKCLEVGLKPHLIYHFFDERILNKIELTNQQDNFTFIGSSGYGYKAHASRYWVLFELLTKSSISLWINEVEENLRGIGKIKHCLKKMLLKNLEQLPLTWLLKGAQISFSPRIRSLFAEAAERGEIELPSYPLKKLFPERCNPALFGLSMYNKLAHSKISFNKHSEPAVGTVDNIRLFQATGVGSCLLTDEGRNIPDLFERDHEIVTYRSMEECLEKVKYLNEHEEIRQNIARNGQIRTLKNHTAIIRYRQVNEIIQSKIS